MNKLRVRFSAGKGEEKTFKYIGFGIQQLPCKIILDHSEYIDNIKNVTIDPKRASENNEPLNQREQTLIRQIINAPVLTVPSFILPRDASVNTTILNSFILSSSGNVIYDRIFLLITKLTRMATPKLRFDDFQELCENSTSLNSYKD